MDHLINFRFASQNRMSKGSPDDCVLLYMKPSMMNKFQYKTKLHLLLSSIQVTSKWGFVCPTNSSALYSLVKDMLSRNKLNPKHFSHEHSSVLQHCIQLPLREADQDTVGEMLNLKVGSQPYSFLLDQ